MAVLEDCREAALRDAVANSFNKLFGGARAVERMVHLAEKVGADPVIRSRRLPSDTQQGGDEGAHRTSNLVPVEAASRQLAQRLRPKDADSVALFCRSLAPVLEPEGHLLAQSEHLRVTMLTSANGDR